MKLLNEDVQTQLRQVLDQMPHEVTIALFTRDGECYTCAETTDFIAELSELNGKLKLAKYDIEKNADIAEKYNVTLTPSMVLLDSNDQYRGIKFNGIPAGHEINSFLSAILEVSGLESEVPEDLASKIMNIDKPVNIKVFVTLGCPHCPGAVQKAHKLALMNSNIEGEMIEAETFDKLSYTYNVSAVPKIVINDKYELVGNQPIEAILSEISKI